MYRDVLTCEECQYYKLKDHFAECFDHPDIYKCTRWNRIVEASDYCSEARKAYPCSRLCKHFRLLAGKKDRYLCVRERIAYYTDLEYSCSYYEKGEEIKDESNNN